MGPPTHVGEFMKQKREHFCSLTHPTQQCIAMLSLTFPVWYFLLRRYPRRRWKEPGEKQPGRTTSADCREGTGWKGAKEAWGGADSSDKDKTRREVARGPDTSLAVNILFGQTLDNLRHTHKCYHLLSAGCERSCDFRWKVAQASATMRSKWSLKIWVVWRGERTEEWSLRTQDGVRDKGQQQGLSHKVVV